MGFIDDLGAKVERHGPRCTVAVWLEANPDTTDADLREGAAKYTAAAVWRLMRERGFESAQQTVSRHLKGLCACPTS